MSGQQVQVQLAGVFTLVSAGTRIPDVELGSRKGRALLKLLVLHRGHIVSTDRIVDALWGDATPAHVDENIAALVSRLRNVLPRESVEGGKGGYVFRAGPGCRVDIDDAEDRVAEARRRLGHGDIAAGTAAADQALEILDRGDLLEEEPYTEWAEAARVAARRLHRAAREVAWAAALGRGDYARAVQVAEAAVAADNLDEEAHRVRMLALYHRGDASRALVAYEELRQNIADELGADPSPESQALHRAILRGEVEAARGGAAATRVESGQMVGRDAELQALVDSWEAVRVTGPSLVLLVGEAGAGKTHLAASFGGDVSRAGALVLKAECHDVERSLFLEPLVNALRPALVSGDGARALAELAPRVRASLLRVVPEIAPLVEEDVTAGLSPEEERARAFGALLATFEALARQRPVLLRVDALQNAGLSTIEFLQFLVRRGHPMPLMVLGTIRDENLGPAEGVLRLATRVQVGPLAVEGIARLAQSFGLGGVPADLAEITGGNALYVVEALRAMRDRAYPEIPDTLRATVRHRVGSAGQELALFLRAAAVVGPSFDLQVVEEVLDHEATGHAARLGEDALRRKLLIESGVHYQFAHDLIRDAIYQSIPGPTRGVWHGRAATIMQARGEAPQVVGYHAARAGNFLLASDSYVLAADRAARSFSNSEAEEMLSQALAAALSLGDRAHHGEILVRRAMVRVSRDAHDLAEADLMAALDAARVAGDRALEARVHEQRGWNSYFRRDLEHAAARVGDATAIAGHGPEVDLLASRVYHAQGKLDLAQQAAEAALTEAEKRHDDSGQARALSYLSSLDCHFDAYAQAIDRSRRGEVLGRSAALFHPTLNGLFFRGLALGNRGDLGDALAVFQRLRLEAKAGDTDHYEARSLNGEAWIWHELGETARAVDLAEEALAAAAAPTLEEPRANALYQLARAALARDEPERAAVILAEGRALGITAAFGWRYELRALDLEARILACRGQSPVETAAALLQLALAGRAPKFVALALAHLGRRTAAGQVAEWLGSDLLMADVGPAQLATAAAAKLGGGLDPALRPRFAAKRERHGPVPFDRPDAGDRDVLQETAALIAAARAGPHPQ